MMSIEAVLASQGVWNGTLERQAVEATRRRAGEPLPTPAQPGNTRKPGSGRKTGNCTQAVVAYLKAAPEPVTPRTIEDATGFDSKRVNSSLGFLMTRGDITRIGIAKRGRPSTHGGWPSPLYRWAKSCPQGPTPAVVLR